MVVCHCNTVNDRQVRSAIAAGACEADDVADHCGAGADCGSCRPMIDAILAESGVSIRPAAAVA